MKNKINFAVLTLIILLSCSSCFVRVGVGHRRDRVDAEPLRNEMQKASMRLDVSQHYSQIPVIKEADTETD